MLKWGSWLGEDVEIMLSFMLCPNTDLSWSLKAQKSSLDWWCCPIVGRCCWMGSTTLSCLLILGLRRCMLCFLPMYGGHTWEVLVSKFVSLVRFVNTLRIAHKHPQDCWNHYPLQQKGLDLGLWISSLGYPLLPNDCNTIFTCVDCLTKYTVLTTCTLGAGELTAKQVAQSFF